MMETDWQTRLRSSLDESERRRTARAATRAAMSRRRAHGLRDRQAARLARLRAAPQPRPDPARPASTPPAFTEPGPLGFSKSRPGSAEPPPFPPDPVCTE